MKSTNQDRSTIGRVTTESGIPKRPDLLPFPATEENIPRLKAYITEKFSASVFKRSTPFRPFHTSERRRRTLRNTRPDPSTDTLEGAGESQPRQRYG